VSYIYGNKFIILTPFNVSPRGEKPLEVLLPLWGKAGMGVRAANIIILYCLVLLFEDLCELSCKRITPKSPKVIAKEHKVYFNKC
jgi:hypothetical protein